MIFLQYFLEYAYSIIISKEGKLPSFFLAGVQLLATVVRGGGTEKVS